MLLSGRVSALSTDGVKRWNFDMVPTNYSIAKRCIEWIRNLTDCLYGEFQQPAVGIRQYHVNLRNRVLGSNGDESQVEPPLFLTLADLISIFLLFLPLWYRRTWFRLMCSGFPIVGGWSRGRYIHPNYWRWNARSQPSDSQHGRVDFKSGGIGVAFEGLQSLNSICEVEQLT